MYEYMFTIIIFIHVYCTFYRVADQYQQQSTPSPSPRPCPSCPSHPMCPTPHPLGKFPGNIKKISLKYQGNFLIQSQHTRTITCNKEKIMPTEYFSKLREIVPVMTLTRNILINKLNYS